MQEGARESSGGAEVLNMGTISIKDIVALSVLMAARFLSLATAGVSVKSSVWYLILSPILIEDLLVLKSLRRKPSILTPFFGVVFPTFPS